MADLPYYEKVQEQRYHATGMLWADVLEYILRKYVEHYAKKPAYGKEVNELMDEITRIAGPDVLDRAQKEAMDFYLSTLPVTGPRESRQWEHTYDPLLEGAPSDWKPNIRPYSEVEPILSHMTGEMCADILREM